MFTALSLLIGLSIAVSAAPTTEAYPVSQWVPEAGDRVMVDTMENMGYIVRDDGSFTSFPVLSGQRRVVWYIGRRYNAATPEKSWNIYSVDVKGRSMTFGETGTFMRLYNGDEQTPYGIHSHLTFRKMLAEGDRYRSMGCVLVDEDVLKLLVKTFELNGNKLAVETKFGDLDLPALAKSSLDEKPSWLGL